MVIQLWAAIFERIRNVQIKPHQNVFISLLSVTFSCVLHLWFKRYWRHIVGGQIWGYRSRPFVLFWKNPGYGKYSWASRQGVFLRVSRVALFLDPGFIYCSFQNKTKLQCFLSHLVPMEGYNWAASSEFVSSSILPWQILTALAQPFRGARIWHSVWRFLLTQCLYERAAEVLARLRMRRLAWTFAARICDKYQVRLTRPNLCCWFFLHIFCIIFATNLHMSFCWFCHAAAQIRNHKLNTQIVFQVTSCNSTYFKETKIFMLVAIVVRCFRTTLTWFDTREFILERNLTSARFVIRSLMWKVPVRDTTRFIPRMDHSSVIESDHGSNNVDSGGVWFVASDQGLLCFHTGRHLKT